ncbi:hypothetical protein FRB90_002276 [Tulasnella sp. 427]|nr:hypothetical protein FRB90_002276 [Tulasnella sp. 427]
MSASPKRPASHKSFTGHHNLLEGRQYEFVHPVAPSQEANTGLWTIGPGTVIWRIWPAVLLHSAFAAAVVVTSDKTPYYLAIANSLLIVIGVVIGFVIAYRASSGIDRYTQGRAMWGDVIKTCRTFSRLIWFHVPARMTSSGDPTEDEVRQAIAEKKTALGLIEGYAVGVKHHLRGETGIYYADLYYLTLPLHQGTDTATATINDDVDSHYVGSPPPVQITFNLPENLRKRPKYSEPPQAGPSTSQPNNDYGSIPDPTTVRNDSETRPLLPSAIHRTETVDEAVATSFIPFWGVFHWLWDTFTLKSFRKRDKDNDYTGDGHPYSYRGGRKRPKIAGRGQNLPLEIVRALSEWVAALDARGTAVAIASFLYLGFLAAGEEIEQPFGQWTIVEIYPATERHSLKLGYEENDLDLDLFIREIIHVNIDSLLARSAPNSYGALKPKDAPGADSQGRLADACKAQIAAKEAQAKQRQQAQVVADTADELLSA